jgi:uncharacterized protein
MQTTRTKYYPTSVEAVHLLVLYVFLQSLVDFPLALYDYHHDTHWLNNAWIGSISTVAITLFIFIFGYKKAQLPFIEVFGLRGFNPLYVVPVLLMLPAMQFMVELINKQVNNVLPPPPWFWELFERIFNNRFGFWGSVVKVAVIAPVVEEVLFRGIIMNGLMRNYRPWYAILLSGILFSVFHLNPWQMTYTFFLGLLLGWLMVTTKSLPLCILTHSLNNLLVLLSIVWQERIEEHALFNMTHNTNIKLSIMLIVSGIIIIVLISSYRKKKNVNFAPHAKK